MAEVTPIFIMCAGSHERFGEEKKWLMPIGKETVVGRIRKQSNGRVVARDSELDGDIILTYPVHSLLRDILMVTEGLDNAIILLGDVIFSEDCMDKILNYKGDVGFFMSQTEIFDLVYHKKLRPHFEKALLKTSFNVWGKLWSGYRKFRGIPIGNHVIVKKDTIIIDDFTTDIDTKDEYNTFISSDLWRTFQD